jgi:HEPN domain-containing protein
LTRAEIEREAGRRYLQKAIEFLHAAEWSFDRRYYNACGGNAIHAGISANDSFLAWRFGVRSTSAAHLEAVEILESAGGRAVKGHVIQLRGLLKRKSFVEYDEGLFDAKQARVALTRAQRLVAWVRSEVEDR